MEAKVYNQEGKEAGKIKLPEKVFSLPWNGDLVHQVVWSMRSNARRGTADTKDRSEVRGGGKKPWRQKGTGRARHGSSRSPIWVGGGVTHGPRSERNYDKKINSKMKTKALFTILSDKLRGREILFIDHLDWIEPKTKQAKDLLKKLSQVEGREQLGYQRGKRVLLVTPKPAAGVKRSFGNIKSAQVEEVEKINPLQILNYKYLIMVDPTAGLESLSKRIK